jgi:hypothetical protein
MIEQLVSLIARFGLPAVAGSVLLYMLIRGEFIFRYPRKKPDSKATDLE